MYLFGIYPIFSFLIITLKSREKISPNHMAQILQHRGLLESISNSSLSSTDESLSSSSLDTLEKSTTKPKSHVFTRKSQLYWKLFLAVFGVTVMFFARINMPDNPVAGIEDRVLMAFQGLNNWIHQDSNASYRRIMLFLCATQIDLIFFTTLIYWVFYGKTGRLPVTIAIFYFIRALVQSLWWSPYPAGYYWNSPGFPSFVAPYGRGSDFFFSGHSGFLVLMANEWNNWGKKKMRNYVLMNLVYTIFILIVYQAHYSIDIFTGVFFADYCYRRIDSYKQHIDQFFKNLAKNIETFFFRVSHREMMKKSI